MPVCRLPGTFTFILIKKTFDKSDNPIIYDEEFPRRICIDQRVIQAVGIAVKSEWDWINIFKIYTSYELFLLERHLKIDQV
jgi:hypothetical protein